MASYLGGSQLLSPVRNINKQFTNLDVFGRVMYSAVCSDEESTTIIDDKLKVFLRIKPWDINSVDDTINTSNYCVNGKTLITKSTNQKHEEVNSTFHFTDVYLPSTTQEVIYENVVKRNLKSFLLGDSCLIFAYGTSNSGKSYTMQGTGLKPGIIPRVLYTIFNSISGNEDLSGKYYPDRSSTVIILNENQIANHKTYKEKLLDQFAKESRKKKRNLRGGDLNDSIRCTSHEEMEDSLEAIPKIVLPKENKYVYSIWLSFAEIYNETLFDLLVDAHEQQPLNLAEDADKNNYIKGLRHINVHSWVEAYELYRYGKNNLHISQTVLNKKSSRSHCLLSIKVVIKNVSDDALYSSSFTICDLAGSERQKRAGTAGTMRCKEAQNINASLLVLNRCIESLRKNQKIKGSLRIPFRESKLTKLFKNFLTGEGSVTMVANISQDPTLFYETQQVLKMTADAYKIKIIASDSNEVIKAIKLKLKELDKLADCKEEDIVQNRLIVNKPVAICRRCGEYKKIIEKQQTDLKNKEEALEYEKNSRRLLEESKVTESNITEIYKSNYEKMETRYNSYKKRADEDLYMYQNKVFYLEAKHDEYVDILQDTLAVEDTSVKALIYKACSRIQLLEKMNSECKKNFDDLKDDYEKFLNVDHQALLKENAELKGRVSYLEEKIEKCDLIIDNKSEEEQMPKINQKEDLNWTLDGNTTICLMKKTTTLKAKEGENLSSDSCGFALEKTNAPINELDGNRTFFEISDPDITEKKFSSQETSNYSSPEPSLEATQKMKYLNLKEIQDIKNLDMEIIEGDENFNLEEIENLSRENTEEKEILNLEECFKEIKVEAKGLEDASKQIQDNANLNLKEGLEEIKDNGNSTLEEHLEKVGDNGNLTREKHLDKAKDNSNSNLKEIQSNINLSLSPEKCSEMPTTVKKSKKKLLPKRAVHLRDDFVPQETAEPVVIPSPGSILSSLRPRKKK